MKTSFSLWSKNCFKLYWTKENLNYFRFFWIEVWILWNSYILIYCYWNLQGLQKLKEKKKSWTFTLEERGPELLLKKFFTQKLILTQKIFFTPKIFSTSKFFLPKNFFYPETFATPKIILKQKNFGPPKNFDPKIFLTKKIFF